MQLKINIYMNNEAFKTNNVLEVVKILTNYTKEIAKNGTLAIGNKEILLDSDGHIVGKAKISHD